MNSEIAIFDQLRARLDEILYSRYTALYTILTYYTNQDLVNLYSTYRYDSTGVEHFTDYEETRDYINWLMARNPDADLPPAPFGGWGLWAAPLRLLVGAFKANYAPPSAVEGQAPNFMETYFNNPADIQLIWQIFEDFKVQVTEMLNRQFPDTQDP
jgi:hypothetical protein